MSYFYVDDYDVLVLHREFDNTCVVRLRGFQNDVFWREVKLNSPFAWLRIQRAKDAARGKSAKLRRAAEQARHVFEGAVGVESDGKHI